MYINKTNMPDSLQGCAILTTKGNLTSEGILNLVPLSTKIGKSPLLQVLT